MQKKSIWRLKLYTLPGQEGSSNLFYKKTCLEDGRGDLRNAQPLNPETLNAIFPVRGGRGDLRNAQPLNPERLNAIFAIRGGRGDLRNAQPLNPETLNAIFPVRGGRGDLRNAQPLNPERPKFLTKVFEIALPVAFAIYTYANMNVAGGHTASNAPDLFRPPKLSGAGPG